MYNENCKGNLLIVMVTASPTTNNTKCRMKHVVLQPCNGACLINNIKKKIHIYCRRVSVFKRLRDERRNCSKSRSLSCKILRRGILTIRCFCSEFYISVGSSYRRKRERERVKKRETSGSE